VGHQVEACIVGWDSTVGAWSRLENHCVLGEDVTVKVRVALAGAPAYD
jgi:mannose-1-phosphate guanylyltransferase